MKLRKVSDIKKRSKAAQERWLALRDNPFYYEGGSYKLSARKPDLDDQDKGARNRPKFDR